MSVNPSRAVISSTTLAATGKFHVRRAPARLSATGLAGAEEVDLFVLDGDITTIAYDADGAAIKLTATKPQVVLDAPGPYHIAKDATAAASAVFLAEQQ